MCCLWCHLACRAVFRPRPLNGAQSASLPDNGGCRQADTAPPKQGFPAALGDPFVRAAFRPVPSFGGSLWVRLQFYFRLIGLAN